MENTQELENILKEYRTQLEKNYDEMKKYYLMAIEKDHILSMYNLALYYKTIEINYDLFNCDKIYKEFINESNLYKEPKKLDGILWNKLKNLKNNGTLSMDYKKVITKNSLLIIKILS